MSHERTLWGEEEPRQPKPENTPVLRIIIVLLLSAIIPAVVTSLVLQTLLVDTSLPEDKVSPFVEAITTTLPLIVGGAGVMIVVWLTSIIPSITTRKGRSIRLIATFATIGIILAALTYLGMTIIIPDSTQAERWVLPVLIGSICVIAAPFSLWMPIWPVNVPDNAVWMILDTGDHLLRYVGSGTHRICPLQDARPYEEKGSLVIEIDDESFVSSDYFPYRVRARIVCTYNPLQADPAFWVRLRSMTRAMLEKGLKEQIQYILREEIARYGREQLKLQPILNAISQRIKEAVEERRQFGIRLIPINPINVFLDPPELVLDTRQRRMSLEALALADQHGGAHTLGELLKLAALETGIGIDIDAQGQVTFALTPGKDIEIGSKLERVIAQVAQMLRRWPSLRQQAPRIASGIGPPPALPEGLPGPEATQPVSNDTERYTTSTQPMDIPEPPREVRPPTEDEDSGIFIPSDPLAHREDTNDVVDTEEDSPGVFIPSDPIDPKPGD